MAIDYAPGAPILTRKLFLRGMNYFDERYGDYWSDLELCWQLRNAGKRILCLPQVHVLTAKRLSAKTTPSTGLTVRLGLPHISENTSDQEPPSSFDLGRRSLRFSERSSMVSAVLSGQKVDGSHL